MNNRANIMYFFVSLCEQSASSNHSTYIFMLRRDILRIIDLVAPDDGSGASNVKVVRKVLHALSSKNFLEQKTVAELEECIASRDTLPAVETQVDGAGVGRETRDGGARKLDKRQIEQRIEEDRERHKRLRESIWAVGGLHGMGNEEEEFARLCDETSDVGEDDYDIAGEEAEERGRCAEVHRLEQIGL